MRGTKLARKKQSLRQNWPGRYGHWKYTWWLLLHNWQGRVATKLTRGVNIYSLNLQVFLICLWVRLKGQSVYFLEISWKSHSCILLNRNASQTLAHSALLEIILGPFLDPYVKIYNFDFLLGTQTVKLTSVTHSWIYSLRQAILTNLQTVYTLPSCHYAS